MLNSTRNCNRRPPLFRFWKWNRNSQMSRARSHAPPAVVSGSHDPPNMLCHRLLRHQNTGATQQGRKEGWPFVNFNRKEMARNTEQFCCIAAERNFWIAVLFDDWLLIVGGWLRINRRLCKTDRRRWSKLCCSPIRMKQYWQRIDCSQERI